MTVCIAAILESTNQIVVVTDSLISSYSAEQSVDGVVKLFFLPRKRWAIMFSGDARYATPLIERIKAAMPRESDISLADLIQTCVESHRVELLRRVETEILLPYGMTREEFFSTGRSSIGEVRFDYIVERITQTDVGADLLVAGFDESGYPHIFELSANGSIVRQKQLAFHAIGSGALLALTALYPIHAIQPAHTLADLLYRCCAAKFTAESSPAVGQQTVAYAFGPKPNAPSGHCVITYFSGVVDKLRTIWLAHAHPPVPDEVTSIVADWERFIQSSPSLRNRISMLMKEDALKKGRKFSDTDLD